MLSGLKVIPRDQIDKAKDEPSNGSKKERRKSSHGKEKERRKRSSSCYSSSDDEALERIKSASRKKKKWYASDDDLSSDADGSGSYSDLEQEQKKTRSQKREKKKHDDSFRARSRGLQTKNSRNYSSEDEASYSSESEESVKEEMRSKGGRRRQKKVETGRSKDDAVNDDGNGGSESQTYNNVVRKEMGLDWMLRPKEYTEMSSGKAPVIHPKVALEQETKKVAPRELNPYLKDNGTGYPEESDSSKTESNQLLSSAVVGDGGASWRLKALKRAKEQAAREGREIQEVVEERWGSMGQFATSVASRTAAPSHAHLQAIRSRRKGLIEEENTITDRGNDISLKKTSDEKSIEDIPHRHPKMRMPKVQDSLSWRKQRTQNMSAEDAQLVSAAMSSINKFANDGSFMQQFMGQKDYSSDDPGNSSHKKIEGGAGLKSVGCESKETDGDGTRKPAMSANQLAAKALQLRMKGKHEEAEKLLKEAENVKTNEQVGVAPSRPGIDGTTSRYILHDVSLKNKKKEDDADMHLAQKIMRSHQHSMAGRADEEYDYDDGPRRKKKARAGNDRSAEITNSAKRFMTQEERCQFCFENPTRPKHLVIAIANFTYLSLPQWQPVVPGHCCILTLQHEVSTRSVDDNMWDEIRNFKKCLIMMFAKQEKEVLFLETVMGLAKQRRHCLVECVPLPQEIAKQAPVYFKKAIDEAEEEWSQHNAKKLIDTSEKGLRGSIPKNFPYFHVEFGLNKGFVHVIDDEKEFKSSFGLNIIRGMMRLPVEDMHRRRRHESAEMQKQAVASFAQDWEPFDWTKQLE